MLTCSFLHDSLQFARKIAQNRLNQFEFCINSIQILQMGGFCPRRSCMISTRRQIVVFDDGLERLRANCGLVTNVRDQWQEVAIGAKESIG